MFRAVHDQLVSLDRDAQLTCCFSAVAKLLVHIVQTNTVSTVLKRRKMFAGAVRVKHARQ